MLPNRESTLSSRKGTHLPHTESHFHRRLMFRSGQIQRYSPFRGTIGAQQTLNDGMEEMFTCELCVTYYRIRKRQQRICAQQWLEILLRIDTIRVRSNTSLSSFYRYHFDVSYLCNGKTSSYAIFIGDEDQLCIMEHHFIIPYCYQWQTLLCASHLRHGVEVHCYFIISFMHDLLIQCHHYSRKVHPFGIVDSSSLTVVDETQTTIV